MARKKVIEGTNMAERLRGAMELQHDCIVNTVTDEPAGPGDPGGLAHDPTTHVYLRSMDDAQALYELGGWNQYHETDGGYYHIIPFLQTQKSGKMERDLRAIGIEIE